MANEARLNLTITARDDAKLVFEEFAKSIKSIMESIKLSISEAMNMSQAETKVREGVVNINQTFNEINISKVKNEFNTLQNNISVDMSRIEVDVRAMSESVTLNLNEITKSSGHLEEALDFQNLQMAGQMIEEFGEKIVGFFEKAVESAVDFDQNIVNTSASLNSNLPDAANKSAAAAQGLAESFGAVYTDGKIQLSSDAIQVMKDKALDLGNAGFFSAQQIADAMNVMARQGINYQQIMEGGIETVSAVAAANQSDISSTANVVSDIIHEMGSELATEFGPTRQEQMAGIGDAMTAALHHARISMEDFLNTMKYVGPQASALGVGITDVSAAIALLGEHGIRGSQAGTTLRRMLTNLTPASAAAADTMAQLGMITENGGNIFYTASGQMKPLAEVQRLLYEHIHNLNPEMQELAVKTIFGQYALSGMTAIVNAAPEKFNELQLSMSKTGVTTDLVAEKSKGWGIQLQALHAHIDTFMKDLGERLKPAIEVAMALIDKLLVAWKGLSEPIKTVTTYIIAITGVVLLLGGALLATIGTIGMFATSFSAGLTVLTKGFGLAKTAASGFFTTLLTNPMSIVVVAIVAAVALLAYEIYKHWDDIKKVTKEVWDYIGPTIIGAVQKVSDFWKDVWPKMQEILKVVFAAMLAILGPFLSEFAVVIVAGIGFIEGAWNKSWDAIVVALKTVWDLMVGIIRLAWDVVSGLFKIALDMLTGHWSDAWNDMKQLLGNVWEDIKILFTNFVNNAENFGKDLVMAVADGIMGSIHAVADAATRVVNTIKSIFSTAPSSPSSSGGGGHSYSGGGSGVSNAPAGYAEGGVITKPTLALVGEGGENEWIIPESKMSGLLGTSGSYPLPSVNNNSGGNRSIVINVNVEGRTARSDDELAERIAQKFRTQVAMVM